jgi:hypothetical protein
MDSRHLHQISVRGQQKEPHQARQRRKPRAAYWTSRLISDIQLRMIESELNLSYSACNCRR